MTELNAILLQASNGQQGSGWSGILMIVAMIVIFYFFMIRPQQKQRKKMKEQREAMKPGCKVVTAGGIVGVLKEMGDKFFMVEVDKGVTLKIGKDSIYPLEEEAPKKEKEQPRSRKEQSTGTSKGATADDSVAVLAAYNEERKKKKEKEGKKGSKPPLPTSSRTRTKRNDAEINPTGIAS